MHTKIIRYNLQEYNHPSNIDNVFKEKRIVNMVVFCSCTSSLFEVRVSEILRSRRRSVKWEKTDYYTTLPRKKRFWNCPLFKA